MTTPETPPAGHDPEHTPKVYDVQPRPASTSPQELGFTPRHPVPWLAPRQLASVALRVGLAEFFGAYLDKRELQAALPAEVFDHSRQSDGELWFDYVADTGDGFNATYSVAWLLAQRSLTVEGADLPRGEMLVMGGDQVYPTPSWEEYEDRCRGPYRAALPNTGGDQLRLYALAGNHDWYDGLTAFLRLFGKRHSFGGWRTGQARSYFALKLPHGWWLYAIDAQNDAYLDDPQLTYFAEAAEQLSAGDRVIVCAPRPTWVFADREASAYDTVDYFIRSVIEPAGARVPVILAGDMHHYARYARKDPNGDPNPSVPRHLITCGGGGAYLYPTHTLPERLQVPPERSLVRRAPAAHHRYELAATYPTREASRRLSWEVFTRLPRRNPGFATLLGVWHTLMMLAFLAAGSTVLTVLSVGFGVVTYVATTGFALPESFSRRERRHWLLGILHGTVQIGLAIGGTAAWAALPFAHLPGPLPLLYAAVLYFPVAGFVATEVVAAYLLFASWYRVNANELFAGQTIEDRKSFLRLRIDADGALTIYPIAVDTVCQKWRSDPGGEVDDSWLAPEQPLTPRLAEPPIKVAP